MRRLSLSVRLVTICAASALACSSSSSSGTGSGSGSGGSSSPAGGDGSSESGNGGDPGKGEGQTPAGPAPVTYKHVTLGFDDVPTDTHVTNQYAQYAVFSSDPGCSCDAADDADMASSKPNYIFTYYTCDKGETASIFADFAKPVRGIKFKLVGVNNDAKVAAVRLVKSDGTSVKKDVTGPADDNMTLRVDVSSESDVKRLELIEVSDDYGLGLDDLELDFPDD